MDTKNEQSVGQTHEQGQSQGVAAVAAGSRPSPVEGVTVWPKVSFYEYNPRRRARGKEAVRMVIQWDANFSELLWMSRLDIVKNIKLIGDCEAFQRGLACYSENSNVQGRSGEQPASTSVQQPQSNQPSPERSL